MRNLEARVRDNRDREWIITGYAYKDKYRDLIVDVECCECIIKSKKREKRLELSLRQAENYLGDVESILISAEL